jgi:phosphoribosyl-AMP cyclohydrolase
MTESGSNNDPSQLAGATAVILDAIAFDANGLVPAIAQQADSGEVLMLAWMNRDAVEETLKTGFAHYYSRSRKALWRKGESSGQTQSVRDIRVDCDGDTVLLLVDQKGVACHTGRHNCFFRAPRDGSLREVHPVITSPDALYGKSGDGG